MTTLWERQIAHIDRHVGPMEWRSLRSGMRKAVFRARSGLPSRNTSLESTFELLNMQIASRGGEPHDPELAANIQWQRLRERMLERKLTQRAAAHCRRRVSVGTTKINFWQRRRDWLRTAEEHRLS